MGWKAPDEGPDSVSSFSVFFGGCQTGSPETIHHAQHAQALSIYSGAKTDPYYVQWQHLLFLRVNQKPLLMA